ncbi:MAG: diguanylate cyclase [Desulfobacterales bacterium]|nr:diguanylate cyclase [Desulfobacterales bacterium]
MTCKILVVDDDPSIRESMKEFLNISGYDASLAKNAEDALEYLIHHPVDIVITDIMMDGMNGLELTDQIKKQYDIKVIVITGFSADYSYEEAVNKGASDFIFKPIRFEELILRLKRVIKERELEKERNEMLEKLKKMAITDALTKLYNSRYFYQQLEIEVGRHNRYKHPISLMLLDIDHFKQFNDSYGHLEGDKVLMILGKIIRCCLRKSDTGYRYGGEEFTIILPETNIIDAEIVAKRVQETLKHETITPLPGKVHNITVSIGITEYVYGEELSEFIQRADKAMYQSKANGRNQISIILNTDVE